MAIDDRRLDKARKPGFGLGLLKGMGVTIKHLFKHNTVIEYPDEKQDLGPRTRGVIALKEENCTVCMLCARECPDWCIYIDSHKETLPPKREGGRPRKRNVLDRFAIDYALCMYCGICVEVCPYDALFWSREFEYAEYDIRELTHEKERLSDWMATVLPPPALDEGAVGPAGALAEAPVAAAEARTATPPSAAGATTPASAPSMAAPETTAADADRLPPAPEQTGSQGPPEAPQRPAPPAQKAAAQEEPAQAKQSVPPPAAEAAPSEAEATPSDEAAGETADQPAQASAEAETGTTGSQETVLDDQQKAAFQAEPGPNVDVPHEAPRPMALEPTEDPDAVYEAVLAEQLEKGSSRQVAEARAKVARTKAERGIKRGPTPVAVDKPVPSAPTKAEQQGVPAEPQASGAASSEAPEPEPGPVAPTEAEEAKAEAAPATTTPGESAPSQASSAGAGETPDQVYERVLAEERAKGSSEAVAQGRAKAARIKAEKAQG
ncbi:MAG: 4Fe-4S binding protein [Actinomycetota bacterium]